MSNNTSISPDLLKEESGYAMFTIICGCGLMLLLIFAWASLEHKRQKNIKIIKEMNDVFDEIQNSYNSDNDFENYEKNSMFLYQDMKEHLNKH